MKAREMGWQGSSASSGIQHHTRTGKDMNDVCATLTHPYRNTNGLSFFGISDGFSLDIYYKMFIS